jgi:chorismate-pyruvate lyase
LALSINSPIERLLAAVPGWHDEAKNPIGRMMFPLHLELRGASA